MRLRSLVVAVLLVAARPATLAACSCSADAAGVIRSADAVFSGMLVEQRFLDRTDGPNAELTFRVDRYWKGGHSPTVVLLSYVNGPCSVTYPLGEHLLVYGRRTARGLEGGGYCSRIRPLREAGDDLSLLGRGWRADERLRLGTRGPILLAAGTLLLAVLGLVLLWRGRAADA